MLYAEHILNLYLGCIICKLLCYMSRKVDTFRGLVDAPLSARDFTIIAPCFGSMPLVIQAATFPSESVEEVALVLHGEQVFLPTNKFRVNGTWTFDVPDSTFVMNRQLLSIYLYERTTFSFILIPGILSDEDLSGLVPRNLAGMINTAFMTSVGVTPGRLSSAIVVMGCFIKSIQDVNLSANGATTPVLWRVTVRYNYLKPLFV